MTDAILVLNAGSSSLKFAVHSALNPEAPPLIRGKITGIGTAPAFEARAAQGNPLPKGGLASPDPALTQAGATTALLHWLDEHDDGVRLIAAGHRVVHGGRDHDRPVRVTPAIMADLAALIPLAPLHQPHNLAAIRAVAKQFPELPQVACFDTSFHRTQPRLAQIYAIPRALTDAGILRYGFHGLSYDYIAGVLPDHLGALAEGRVIVAHLGNGASMCAMRERRSVATSMGFTALDGLMMGRRCGALDPGVVLHMIREKGLSATEVEDMLYNRSGLLGVSGLSNDLRVLEASTDPAAAEAIALFAWRAAQELAALAATIGGVDAIVFTAGIGENSAHMRDLICARLGWTGVAIDAAANTENRARISPSGADIIVLVLPTNEELVVAQATQALVTGT